MRNFLTIASIAVFVIFVLVILPTALLASRESVPADSQGRVLGASEAVTDENLAALFQNYNSLPQNSNTAVVEEEKIPEPVKKADCATVDIGEMIGVVIDMDSDKVLFEKEAETQASIASITKIMTALTFLDLRPAWEELFTVEQRDLVGGAQIYIAAGDELPVIDLFNLSLIASANSATKALVRATGLTEEEFVAKMNEKAAALGLSKTQFSDPIGFSAYNLSTPKELALIMKTAMQASDIVATVEKDAYTAISTAGRSIRVRTTNKLLHSFSEAGLSIIGGKTGYTASAGYCFAGGFEDEAGHRLLSVVLGGPSYDSRFYNTDRIVKWSYENYEWK